MPVTNVEKDAENLTLTVVTNPNTSAERAWELWSDPRQLERWWGPPEYPATFVDPDLTPGGRVSYYMTGPEGDTPHGWWRVVSVNPPNSLEIEDGFGLPSHRWGRDSGLKGVVVVDRAEDDEEREECLRSNVHELSLPGTGQWAVFW